jgi:hypothetical protein
VNRRYQSRVCELLDADVRHRLLAILSRPLGESRSLISGAGFQITAIIPEEQSITEKGVTEWKWEVNPTSAGELNQMKKTPGGESLREG